MQSIGKTRAAVAASFVILNSPALAQTAAGEAHLPFAALGDESTGMQTQRMQQQQLESINSTGELADALPPESAREPGIDLTHLPRETPCFPIREIDVASGDRSIPRLDSVAAPAEGQCLGALGIKAVQDAVANELIGKGFITTRVTVPPQGLASGVLALSIDAGRVSDIRNDTPAIGVIGAALPTRTGDVLNQRDIDQALENIRRLPSQADARFDIMPGVQPGESDVVLHPGSARRWRASIGYDNAGQDATGKHELSAALAVDSPLGLYDQLQMYGLTNANRGAPDLGSTAASASWSVPIGYAMLALDASQSNYLQTRATVFGPLQYSGKQKYAGVRMSAVVQRNSRSRTEVRAKFFRTINHNFLYDTSLAMQDRDTYAYELGASHRLRVGRAQFDVSGAWRESLPGISKNPGHALDAPTFSGRQQLEIASASVLAPFSLGGQPFSFQSTWTAQIARTPVLASDYFMIGTRFAVRGFNQQTTLAAESGWAVSNEFDWYKPTPAGVQALYLGVDAGRVRGAAAQYLSGSTLAGMVVGARGTLMRTNKTVGVVGYDLSVGWPLHKPKGFGSSALTMLVQLSVQV